MIFHLIALIALTIYATTFRRSFNNVLVEKVPSQLQILSSLSSTL